MKVLCVSPLNVKSPCGLSTYVLALIDAVARLGTMEIGLFVNRARGENFGKASSLMVAPPIKGLHLNPFALSDNYFNSIVASFGRPDLVHFHGVYQPFQSAFASKLCRENIPYISSLHGGLQDHSQQRKAWKKALGNAFFFDEFLKRATAVHALNEAEAQAVRIKFPGKRVFIMPNGVSDETARISRSVRSYDGRGLVFGFIGRIDMDHKGLDRYLEGIALLQTRRPSCGHRFVFAGPFFGEANEKRFKGAVSKLPDPSAVEYQGVVLGRQKTESFDLFDVFVHTSRYEGMPGAVLEAMAHGVPCLVTPGTNVQELVVGCRGGWGCDFNAADIASRLDEISSARAQLDQKGSAAREYALSHLTWSKIAVQYTDHLKAILGRT